MVKPKKSGHQMAAEGMPFPWRLNRSTISANMELIWEKSVHLNHASSGWAGTVLYFRRAASEDVVKAELSSGDAPVLFPDDEAGHWRRQGKRT